MRDAHTHEVKDVTPMTTGKVDVGSKETDARQRGALSRWIKVSRTRIII